ncbi:MAG: energy-coupling factor transporter transmembrane component T [bacterium]
MSFVFYIERESFFHRLHPVTKIVLLVLGFAAALVLERPLYILLLWLIFAWAARGTGVFQSLRRVWWLLFLIALASFGIWSVAYHGKTVLFELGPFSATREGMLFGAGMGLRLDLMIFCGLVFLATTTVEDFTYGLTRMGLPFPVSFSLSLSFRLVPLFGDTIKKIMDAQKARGLDLESVNVFRRMQGYVPLLVPVFSSALRKTDQLAVALESKGFGLPGPRGNYLEYRAGARDAGALLAMILIIAAEVWIRLQGMGAVS